LPGWHCFATTSSRLPSEMLRFLFSSKIAVRAWPGFDAPPVQTVSSLPSKTRVTGASFDATSDCVLEPDLRPLVLLGSEVEHPELAQRERAAVGQSGTAAGEFGIGQQFQTEQTRLGERPRDGESVGVGLRRRLRDEDGTVLPLRDRRA